MVIFLTDSSIATAASGGGVYSSDQFGSEMDRLSALIDKLEGKVQYVLVCELVSSIVTLLIIPCARKFYAS